LKFLLAVSIFGVIAPAGLVGDNAQFALGKLKRFNIPFLA
jgi:hypothetical protein